MKRLSILITFCMASVLATSVLAQSRQEIERALVRLEKQLAFAREVLASVENPRATDLLRQAEREFDLARMAAGQGRFRFAMTHLLAANELIEQALRISLGEPLRRTQERLEELMRHAEQVVIGSGNEQAERLLREAKANQRQAEHALQRRNIRKALELYRIATSLAEKSIHLVEGRKKSIRESWLEEWSRFEELAGRTREVVESSGNDQARRTLDQALRLGREAQEAVAQGRFALGADLLNKATRLLLRAMDLAGGQGEGIAERARDAVMRLDQLLTSAQERLPEEPSSRCRVLFDEAQTLSRDAHRALDEGRFLLTLRKTDMARNLIDRALKLCEPNQGPRWQERLDEEMGRLDRKLQSFDASNASAEVRQLLEMARLHNELARKARQLNRPRIAMHHLLAANRFLAAGERLMGGKRAELPSQAVLSRKLADFREALLQLEQRSRSAGQPPPDLLGTLRTLADKAEVALSQGQLVLANEIINNGTALLTALAERSP